MKKAIWWVIGIVVVVIIIVSIAGKSAPTETGPIKIGMITPLSGNVAALGEIMKRATDFAIEEINAAGGVDGRPMSILYEDDQCNPGKSVSAAQKLIEVDKVRVIIGSTCSGAVLSMLPVTDKAKVFVFSGGATSPEITGKSPLFARTIASDSGEMLVLAELAAAKGWKKVAVLQESTDYALASYRAFEKSFSSKGEIAREEYPDTTTDFRSVLTKLMTAKPDAMLIIPQSPATGKRILTNLAQIKMIRIPLMVGHVIAGDADLVSEHKAILEGAYAADQNVDMNNEKYLALEKKYTAKFGKAMDYTAYAQGQYDLVYILREGLQKYGNDGEKISAWVRTLRDFDGASGKMGIDSDGNRIGGHTLRVVKNGKAEVVQ